MLENNLLFSLVSGSIICIIIYCINFKKQNLNEDKKNDIILLFGVTFTTIFILRIISQNNKTTITTGGNSQLITNKPPF
jgi:hypothetical protein